MPVHPGQEISHMNNMIRLTTYHMHLILQIPNVRFLFWTHCNSNKFPCYLFIGHFLASGPSSLPMRRKHIFHSMLSLIYHCFLLNAVASLTYAYFMPSSCGFYSPCSFLKGLFENPYSYAIKWLIVFRCNMCLFNVILLKHLAFPLIATSWSRLLNYNPLWSIAKLSMVWTLTCVLINSILISIPYTMLLLLVHLQHLRN